jgi:hypothetical protein
MSNDVRGRAPIEATPRFPYAALLRALLPALAATALVVFFFSRSRTSAPAPKARADGLMRVTLSQKDSSLQAIPPSKGGASGDVLYAPKGTALHFTLRASALPPGHRYVLEMQVDDAIYTVASYAPDARGELAIDTTLTRFEEGVCVGANFDPPRPVIGRHAIKFWIKRDGSPATGTMPGVLPSAPGAQLACHGNGDGDYDYALLENEVADFTGVRPTASDSAR